jgi:hypothetical protein
MTVREPRGRGTSAVRRLKAVPDVAVDSALCDSDLYSVVTWSA